MKCKITNEEIKTDEVLNTETQAAEQSDKPVFSAKAMDDLKKTAKYMNIISIYYFVIAGLCVLTGLINLFHILLYTNPEGRYVIILIEFVLWLFTGLVVFFIGNYPQNTAKMFRNFGKNPLDIRSLEDAVCFQKGFWRLTTITVLTISGIMLLYSVSIFLTSIN
jgi:hypothetical protein